MDAPPVTRVALLNSARRWIGEAAHVLDLAQGLASRGIAVTVVPRRGHDLERRAREAGLDVVPLTFSSRFAPLADWADVRALRRLCRERRLQVVHAHRGKDHWVAAVALRGLRPRPALVRTRHVVTPVRDHVFNRWLLRRATDRIIAVSDATRRSLATVLPSERLRDVPVILSAVDLSRFDPSRRSEEIRAERFGIPPGGVAVGLIGRYQRVKGQRVLLGAAADLLGRGLPLQFVFAGAERTPGRVEALRAEARARGIASRTVLFSEVEEIAPFIASLDILVVASLGSEGSSRVAYEAMASGVPVVATRVGILPEVITSGENGLLVEPGDPRALAEAVARLATDAPLRARMAELGRRHVETHHAPGRWLDEVQRVHCEAAETRGLRALSD
ncbi:MAG: glycosyltransferase family 4 protein [Candidatus Sumerlaeia bacterium]|nr:glycosyltransferase family 4 protein [Candidatus Sumerlaeia bacterium]